MPYFNEYKLFGPKILWFIQAEHNPIEQIKFQHHLWTQETDYLTEVAQQARDMINRREIMFCIKDNRKEKLVTRAGLVSVGPRTPSSCSEVTIFLIRKSKSWAISSTAWQKEALLLWPLISRIFITDSIRPPATLQIEIRCLHNSIANDSQFTGLEEELPAPINTFQTIQLLIL